MTAPETLKKYLLGDLAEESMESLEDLLLTDAEAFELLNDAEEELIDEFVDGSLSAADERAFERFFLCTEDRRARVQFARALKRYVSVYRQAPAPIATWKRFVVNSPARWFLQPSPALAAVLAVTLLIWTPIGVWSVVSWWRTEAQLDRALALQESIQAEEERLRTRLEQLDGDYAQLGEQLERVRVRKDQLEEEVEKLQGRRVTPALVTALLQPGVLRGESGIKIVSIPKGAYLVQLKLDLGLDEDPPYTVELYDSNDVQILTLRGLAAEASGDTVVVGFTLPADLLTGDYYMARLLGGDGIPLGRYSFQVVRLQ